MYYNLFILFKTWTVLDIMCVLLHFAWKINHQFTRCRSSFRHIYWTRDLCNWPFDSREKLALVDYDYVLEAVWCVYYGRSQLNWMSVFVLWFRRRRHHHHHRPNPSDTETEAESYHRRHRLALQIFFWFNSLKVILIIFTVFTNISEFSC